MITPEFLRGFPEIHSGIFENFLVGLFSGIHSKLSLRIFFIDSFRDPFRVCFLKNSSQKASFGDFSRNYFKNSFRDIARNYFSDSSRDFFQDFTPGFFNSFLTEFFVLSTLRITYEITTCIFVGILLEVFSAIILKFL